MKWNKRIIISVILLIMTVGFSILKLQETVFIRTHYNSESVRLRSEGVTRKDLDNALKNEKANSSSDIPDVTAWVRLNEEEIYNYDLNRKVQVPIVQVAGDMNETEPMSLKYGNYVYEKDSKGCIIDEDTAYSLFGTYDATGNILTYKGSDYFIRGVVKATYPMFMIPGNNAAKYNNLELIYSNKEFGEKSAEEFLLQNSIAANYVIVDGYFYGRLIYSLLNLPIWMFYILFFILLLKYFWKKRHSENKRSFAIYCGIGTLGMIGYGGILYETIGNPLYFPLKLIPTKFSDFDYWSNEYHVMMDQFKKMQYLLPNPKDLYLENELVKLSLNVTVMLLLYLAFFICIRSSVRKNERA